VASFSNKAGHAVLSREAYCSLRHLLSSGFIKQTADHDQPPMFKSPQHVCMCVCGDVAGWPPSWQQQESSSSTCRHLQTSVQSHAVEKVLYWEAELMSALKDIK
jgi:hypothetical protein